MKNDYLLIILILIQLITICYAIHVNMNYRRLKRTYKAFMKGKDGRTLEKSIIENADKIFALESIVEKNKEEIKRLSINNKCSFQKTGIVKYDAFGEEEGALSFALTVLDENNNGWIMNFVQGSSRNYNYIKEIVKGESYIELSNEEKESLEKAMYQEYYDLKLEPDIVNQTDITSSTDIASNTDITSSIDITSNTDIDEDNDIDIETNNEEENI